MEIKRGDNRLLVILGPTACGKTRRAVELAERLNGEIISADSRQIYRNMDIGTGKDLKEYGGIPYHLIDIKPAGYKYNLHEYVRDFHDAYSDISDRGKLPILCGGTGLYIETVLSGIKLPEVPENPQLREDLSSKSIEELTEILKRYKTLHNTTDIDTAKRAIRAIEIACYYEEHPEEALAADRKQSRPLPAYIIGLDIPRDMRRQLISQRLDARLKEGMIEEVRALLDSGLHPENLIYYGLEYKFVTQYIKGELSFAQMHDLLEIAIHQFSKRQMTWFRGMEKRGFKINWIAYDAPIEQLLEGYLLDSGNPQI